MDQLLAHLAEPDIVAFEQRQYDLDPYSPVAAWVAAYTVCIIAAPDGTVLRREVAAGADTLAAMTVPARLVACALRDDPACHDALVELVRDLGPVSVRVALLGGAEALIKARLADDALAALLGRSPDTPLRRLLIEPLDLAAAGAETHLAGFLATVDDPAAAVLEAAELLERFLCAAMADEDAAAAAEAYSSDWTSQRYISADGTRTVAP